MIKAVLFDLDGTLLNRDDSVKRFVDNQYERLNEWLRHIPKAQYISRFIELDKRGYVWKDKVYQQLTQEFIISGVTWEELLQDYLNEFKHSCVPFDHLLQMLEGIKSEGILLGIITNGYGEFQLGNIKALGIEDYFDVIMISEWEGIKKPNPDIFKRALETLNILPEQSIFVGDHPENDVKAAQAVGMKGIWKRDVQWNDANADYIINELLELPTIIEMLTGKAGKIVYPAW